MSTYANLKIDQGTSFDTIIDVVNDDGTPYDLTGLFSKCQMRKSYYTSTAYNLTVNIYGDPLNGQLQLIIQPDDTSDIKPERYVYDIIVYNGDNTVNKRVIEGIINLTPAATKVV